MARDASSGESAAERFPVPLSDQRQLPTIPLGRPESSATDPTRLGRFPVIGTLGRGGMGEVLAVRDPELGRSMAAKVALDQLDGPALQKFVLEAQVTGSLEHPGIPPVHELGLTNDGRVYFTMKAVKGCDLAARLAEQRSGAGSAAARLPEMLAIFVKVCDTLAYAHAHQVIHRDIKPANIMVGEFGEVLVMDWGLARVLGDAATPALGTGAIAAEADRRAGGARDLTQDGAILGTPAYMPPEQALGEIDALDARSDVYALGATLYEILTLEPPYAGETVMAVLTQAMDGKVVPPTVRAPRQVIPWELEAVVLKAMAPRPEQRYPSATALKADVLAYLAGQCVDAATYTAGERAVRWVRRHPTATLAAVLLLVLGSLAGGIAVVLQARARDAQARAQGAELLAMAQKGQIDALIEKLGGQRRFERDAAIAELHARWTAARREGIGFDAFRAGLDAAFAERVERALDALFDANVSYGTTVTAADCFYRGLFRGMRKDLEGELADYDRALALEPDMLEALGNRGNVRKELGQLDAALADFDRALELHPDDCLTRFNRGTTLLAAGRPEAAIADFDRALRIRPDYAAALYNRGTARQGLGQLDLAIADFERMLQLDPRSAKALNNRGLIRRNLGQLDLAIADFDRCLSLEPGFGNALANRAGALQLQGKLDLALADLERAVQLAPKDAELYFQRGALWKARGELDRALADYDRALALRPEYADVFVNRGVIHYLRAELDLALADYERAMAIRPDSPLALVNRGLVHVARGAPEAAGADYDRAIELDRACQSAYLHRGQLRRALGQVESALVDFERAVELVPDDSLALVCRGTMRERLGRPDLALADYDRAIVLRPDYPEALVNRGVLRMRRGELDLALADFDRALGHNATHWQALANRALVLVRLGRREEALAAIERALAHCSEDAKAQLTALRATLTGR